MAIPITGHTGLMCLLGSPCKHSISPMMHNKSFEALGLDYTYLAFETDETNLEAVVNGLKAMNVRGFNLTMPCKNKMTALCDALSPAAKFIGAVNTVVNENGILTGHNTDGIGYMQSVKDAGYDIIGKKMTLLGAGGAATAILVQAALDGVREISVFLRKTSRFYERAEATAKALQQETNCKITLCDFYDTELLRHELADSAIVVNATSIGMAPNTDACPIPDADFLPDNIIVSDIIYNPKETKLLAMAREKGLAHFNGTYMLLYQGAEAFRLWTGMDMPVPLIKNAYFTD